MSQVTINQIAEKTGVSRATAARIVNSDVTYNRPTFAKRAEKIRRLASEMGYRPNAAAKAISTGKFLNVALVMGAHYERSNFTREMIRGIHDALQRRHMRLTVWFLSDEQLDSDAYLPAFLREQMVDGLLINYTHDMPPHMTEAIEHARLPVVWVNTKRDAACVYPDDMSAGRQAVDHLRELGHRRIAFANFIHGPQNKFQPHYSVLDRLTGYEAAMHGASLVPRRIDVQRSLAGTEAVSHAVDALSLSDRPTAVVCQSPRDVAIFEVAAARTGLAVPGDLSLVTFGGERQINSVTDPTLLVEPREAMGNAAVEALFQRIDDPDRPCPAVKVPYVLRCRETTAAPVAR